MNALLTSPLMAPPASLLAGLLLMFLIARLGRGAFPLRLFGASLSIGLVMAVLILFVEAPFNFKTNAHGLSPLTIAFLIAGLPEEAAKMAGAYFFVRPHYLRRSSRDLVLGAASVALGFALLENLLYVQGAGAHWGQLAFSRALTAVPFHVLLGFIGGRALARADVEPNRRRAGARIFATWILLALLHGLYDFPLMTMNAGVAPASFIARLANRLAIAPSALLFLALLGALVAISALAMASLRGLDRAPFRSGPAVPAPSPGRFDRFVLARATGAVVAALLILASLGALAIVSAFSFILDQSFAIYATLASMACPLTIAAMLIAYPPPREASAHSRSGRRWIAYACVALVALGLFAAFRWGEAPVRRVLAARIEMRGIQLQAKGDSEGALREYDRALATDPTFVDAMLKRIGVYYALGKLDQARSDLDDALLVEPDNVELLKMRAQLQRELARPLAAVADLDRAVALRPDDGALRALRAQAYLEAQMPEQAGADLARAEALAPKDGATLMTRALLAVHDGDYDGALAALDEDLRLHPDDLDQQFFRGRLEFYKRDAERAIADLSAASAKSKALYPAIWLFLQRARNGEDGGPELSAAALRVNQYKWPFPIVQFFLGQISAEEMKAAAADGDQRCEADFYYGEWHYVHGGFRAALPLLQAAGEECPRAFIEYEGAQAELRRTEPGRP